jgi:hypothetical protein
MCLAGLGLELTYLGRLGLEVARHAEQLPRHVEARQTWASRTQVAAWRKKYSGWNTSAPVSTG